MEYIKSCGVIVYKRINDINYFLLIKSINNDIGFPKGHLEYGETELETAIRELKEETNVSVDIDEGFKKQIEYKLSDKIDTIKIAIYFLGRVISDNIICQIEEVKEAKFIPYEEALKLLTFVETKELLIEANEFINLNCKGVLK